MEFFWRFSTRSLYPPPHSPENCPHLKFTWLTNPTAGYSWPLQIFPPRMGAQQPLYLSTVLKTCKVAVRQSLPNKIRSTLGSDDTPNSLSEAIIPLEVVTTAAVLVRKKCVRIYKEAVRYIDRPSCHHNQSFVVVSNTTNQLLIGLFFTTTDICSYSACISPSKAAYELRSTKQYQCHH